MKEGFVLKPDGERSAIIEMLFEVYSVVSVNTHALAEFISSQTSEPVSDILSRLMQMKGIKKEEISDYIFENFGHMGLNDILPLDS